MRRIKHQPRPNWQSRVESEGMHYHSEDDVPYWDESAYYEFTANEIDEIDAATTELQKLCLEAVQHVLDEDRLNEFLIPEPFHNLVRASWENDEPSLYGRFDLRYDGVLPPKLLEYNADTPTGLLEAAVIQWTWLQDCFPNRDQFNSIHERLIEGWAHLRETLGPADLLHLAAVSESLEDHMNVAYLRDTAIQGGWQTEYLDIEQIGWDAARGDFTDLEERPIDCCFKLYPWEWLMREEFGRDIPLGNTRWIEPAWKALLSNKALLVILWELFPDHENLLPASFEPLHGGTFAAKPILGREGANVRLMRHGRTRFQTDGTYGDEPMVYQELCELPEFDGQHPCIGSWLINDWACGIGIREDISLVTGNMSRFIPHVF